MQSLSSGTEQFLSSIGGEQAKALHIAKNNAALKQAIEQVWSTRPDAAKWLLTQINAMYIELDESPRKGNSRYLPKPAIMKLYIRDAMARAEFNAKRENLLMALEQNDIHVSEIKLIQSRGDAKQHRLFSDKAILASDKTGQSGKDLSAQETEARRYTDQMKLLETFRRAICLSFGDPEEAYALLEKAEGACLYALKSKVNRRNAHQWYRVVLYVDERHVSELKQMMAAYEDTIKSKARRLQLNLVGISVAKAPAELQGRQAFPRTGQPIPYLPNA